MDSHDETGCQAPERPILCTNNCGFFGRAATMNMCSKCYKDTLIKQEQEELAASSIDSIVNGKESLVTGGALDLPQDFESRKKKAAAALVAEPSSGEVAEQQQQGPSRCAACRKRVGLTGFKCKCGDLFCSSHRYSDKHECPFDYRTAGRDAIARANPVVKAEKLDKI